ncbi:hypothetical protein HSR122_0168 [Halapricum desulfuricans]|uniref:Uncharacterized protein n=1 Tax=Halapricum desulfuricans TaxID=2841257 RepID=A0A897N8M7_9EURY|nr:hypothetical protein HSR122_0168 [Halapricum desulfuricans]
MTEGAVRRSRRIEQRCGFFPASSSRCRETRCRGCSASRSGCTDSEHWQPARGGGSGIEMRDDTGGCTISN